MSKEKLDFLDYVEKRLPEYEILLSFQNDSGAEKFHNWWDLEGQYLFDKFCEEYESELF